MNLQITFLTSLLLSLYASSSIGQTITLENRKETKSVLLEASRIVEIEINNRKRYKGCTVGISDSTLSMETRIKSNRNRIDTLITVNLSEITEIIYCTKEKKEKCEPKKMVYLPIISFTGLLAISLLIPSEANPVFLIIPTGVMAISDLIYLITKPKKYRLGLNWEIAH